MLKITKVSGCVDVCSSRRWGGEGGEREGPHHPGQKHVAHDGQQDDHAGCDEVAERTVLQLGASWRRRHSDTADCQPLCLFTSLSALSHSLHFPEPENCEKPKYCTKKTIRVVHFFCVTFDDFFYLTTFSKMYIIMQQKKKHIKERTIHSYIQTAWLHYLVTIFLCIG